MLGREVERDKIFLSQFKIISFQSMRYHEIVLKGLLTLTLVAKRHFIKKA